MNLDKYSLSNHCTWCVSQKQLNQSTSYPTVWNGCADNLVQKATIMPTSFINLLYLAVAGIFSFISAQIFISHNPQLSEVSEQFANFGTISSMHTLSIWKKKCNSKEHFTSFWHRFHVQICILMLGWEKKYNLK